MYLNGLRGAFSTGSSGGNGYDTIQNVSESQCVNQYHGLWSAYGQGGNYVMNPMGTCNVPRAAAPTPAPAPAPQISVSVPTNVNTQVSPQVSPNLIQQQQPTNSPVGAATSANPSQTTAGDAAYQAFLDQLKQQHDADAAAAAADRDALMQAMQSSQAAPTAAAPVVSYLPGDAPAPDQSGAVVTVQPQPENWLVKGSILAALLIGGAILYSKHPKQRSRHVRA